MLKNSCSSGICSEVCPLPSVPELREARAGQGWRVGGHPGTCRAAQLWVSLPGVLAADPPWSRDRRGLEGSFPGSWGYHRPCSFGHPSPLTPVGFALSIPTVPIIQNGCSSDEVNDIISEQAAEWVIWEAAGKLGASWPLSWAAVPRAG